MKILTVEDDPSIRRVIALALKSGGYETAEADTGKDGLDAGANVCALGAWLIGTLTYHFVDSSSIGPTLTSLITAGILAIVPLAKTPLTSWCHI